MNLDGEKRDIRFGSIMIASAGLLGLVGFGLLLSWGMYMFAREQTYHSEEVPGTFTRVGTLPPEPRLETDPHGDLLRLRAAEDSVLLGYAWVNRDSGFVRIPVARAMAILARRGLPVRGSRADVSR
jgi:hypothetical protein